MTRFALLGSPFLGPEVWEPTAVRLRELGHPATVVVGVGASAQAVLDHYQHRLGEDVEEEMVLVPHSNAGLYVAALAARLPVAAAVFVDALLPGASPTTPVTSPELRSALVPLGAEGLLPPWLSWWPAAEAEALLPDASAFAAVSAGQPRVPAAYLSDEVPTPGGWDRLPVAYLAFGDAYADEIETARGRGWPLRRLEGRHLHPVVDPGSVARSLLELSGELLGPRASRST